MYDQIVEYFYWTKEHHILAATTATLWVCVHEFWKRLFKLIDRRFVRDKPIDQQ